MPVRDIILERAAELFLSRGFSLVTTQEIAARAGISKKTLYQHFTSKQEILRRVVRFQMDRIRVPLEAAFDDPELDFITRTHRILAVINDLFARMGSGLIQDIYRSAPEIWQEIDDFRREHFFQRLRQHILQGHAQGIIRADLDPALIARIYLHIIQHLITPEQLIDMSLSAQEMLASLVKILFAGILTDSARDKFFTKVPGTPSPKETNHEKP